MIRHPALNLPSRRPRPTPLRPLRRASLPVPAPVLAALLATGALFWTPPPGALGQERAVDASLLRLPAETGVDRIHRLSARVRHTTVIVLPAEERILDFVVGDSEYWHLTGSANIAFLKPLAEATATNVALICESGSIYSFLVAETGDKPAHLIVRITADGDEGVGRAAGEPAFVARSEVAAYREMASQAAAAGRDAQSRAQDAIDAFVAQYPGRLAFEYTLPASASRRPFLIDAMWHDGRFTYIRSRAQESPALYEEQDGEPSLVSYELSPDGLYIARRVLGDGWLQIGRKRVAWSFTPDAGRPEE